MRVYLDANILIYSVESAPPFRDAVLTKMATLASAPDSTMVTSRLSRLECRVKPLREKDAQLLAKYDALFAGAALRLVEIGPAVVDLATELRVRRGLKTPDAIHVATAIEERADIFLTGDRQLSRCAEINVEVLA